MINQAVSQAADVVLHDSLIPEEAWEQSGMRRGMRCSTFPEYVFFFLRCVHLRKASPI